MELTVELSVDEARRVQTVQAQGVNVVQLIKAMLAALPENETAGARIVAEWQREGVIGSRTDIIDSQQHARKIRERAERRSAK